MTDVVLHRQPRRDRAPRHAHRRAGSAAHRRGLHRPRRRRARTCTPPTRRCGCRATSTSTRSSRPPSTAAPRCVHPGYGFLSERARFAARARGGRRHAGRAVRRGHGADGPQGRRPRGRGRGRACPSCRPATDAGYPVLVKAAAGGGGKGMRIVRVRGRDGRGGRGREARGARRRSATTRCWSRSTSSTAATSRCRSSATATAPCSTSSSATARPSAATRRCSRRRRRRPSAAAVRELVTSVGRRAGAPRRLRQRRHRRVPARRRHRRGLLPGDEHPAPGRAPGHRAGHRPRPGRAPAAGRRRASRSRHPGRRPARRATRSRRGSTPRTRSAASCRRPATASIVRWPAERGRPRRPRAGAATRSCPRRTTRCSAR